MGGGTSLNLLPCIAVIFMLSALIRTLLVLVSPGLTVIVSSGGPEPQYTVFVLGRTQPSCIVQVRSAELFWQT